MKKKNTFKIIALLCLYYFLLFWIYENLISSRWSYNGFVNEFSDKNFSFSILGFVFTTFTYLVLDKKNLPSSIVMNLFNLMFYIPMYVFIAYKKTVDVFIFYLMLYQFVLFFFYIKLSFSFKQFLKRSKRVFYLVIGFILLSTLFINGYYNGFQIKIDLENVYENRLAVRDMSIPSILNYIKEASYFVGIIALMYAMKIKNWFLIIFVVLLQLMSFAFGASKTQFFTIFICIIAFMFYTDKVRLWAPVSLVSLLIISVIEYLKLDSTTITDMWTRRTLFMPPKISYDIFDFFEDPNHDFLYLRGSIFRFLGFQDPYFEQEGFQRLIGSLYGGNEDTNANTGLLGNDYAQLGWWSVLIFPLMRIYILKLYDYCAIGIDKRIMVVISIFVTFTFISGAFFTVLVTKAILLVCYLLYNFPRNRKTVV